MMIALEKDSDRISKKEFYHARFRILSLQSLFGSMYSKKHGEYHI